MKNPSLLQGLLVLIGCLSVTGTAPGSRIDDSCLETWELENFQPLSPTFQQTVKSSYYHARTTVVMLLSAG